MGEKDSEAPFRFIRNFSVLSVTLALELVGKEWQVSSNKRR